MFFRGIDDDAVLNASVRAVGFSYYYFFANADRYVLSDLKSLAGGFGSTYDYMINYAAFLRRKQTGRVNFWIKSSQSPPDPEPDFSYFWKGVWFVGSAFSEQRSFNNWDIEESPWTQTRFVVCFVESCKSLIRSITNYEQALAAISQELLCEVQPSHFKFDFVQRLFETRPDLLEIARECFSPALPERTSSQYRSLTDAEYYARRQFGPTQLTRVANGYPAAASESQMLSFKTFAQAWEEKV